MLAKLARAGMDVARLNFSHGTLEEHRSIISRIRKLSLETGMPLAVLQDLPGPKFRVGTIRAGAVQLRKGSTVTLTTRPVEGNDQSIPLRSPELPNYVVAGESIFLSDGSLKLKVLSTTSTEIRCRCEVGGALLSGKGVNVPRLKRGFVTFTPNDKKFLKFGLEQGVDLVAVSFVRSASDIRSVRNFMGKKGRNIPIFAKIEKKEGVDNIDEIVRVADGIMVARGDLGVENPIEEVPELQKQIISASNARSIPVITATQMLESMVNNASPTRAEVTDVANSIFDGTDAVMLSEETAVGKYPAECVETLDKVALRAEERMRQIKRSFSVDTRQSNDMAEAIGVAATTLSVQLGAEAIVTKIGTFRFASMISHFRPSAPIIAISDEQGALRRSNIIWGVYPFRAHIRKAETWPIVEKLVKEGLLSGRRKVVMLTSNDEASGQRSASIHVLESPTSR